MNEEIVFGTGCFWCTEAEFRRVKGVISVTPGYAGGETKNPTYESVSSGKTGHAEVTKIEFDPKIISLPTLLKMFWKIHDPTSLNKQGNDVGPQYRSIILYTSEQQKKMVEASKNQLEEAKTYETPIVTEIKKLEKFYPAEEYHLNYFDKNAHQPYCSLVITPKIKKFKEEFKEFLKKD